MFSLGIRYLMGWAMAAADGAEKERAEWPPHPDRVFMALAAAWFETGQDAAEGDALRWLECLPAPQISASEFKQRSIVTHFVPVDDTGLSDTKTIKSLVADSKTDLGKLKKAGLGQLPEFRSRQPRAFPVAIPKEPEVHLIWEESIPEAHRAALAALCAKVGSIGHSASLVQMWLQDMPPPATLAPVTGWASQRMRIFGPGRLTYLEQRMNRQAWIQYHDLNEEIRQAKADLQAMTGESAGAVRKQKHYIAQLKTRLAHEYPHGEPVSLRPQPGLWQGYARPIQAVDAPRAHSVFDPRLVVLTLSGKRLPLPATLKLTEALRGALLKDCPQPIPEWVSGHDAEGHPSRLPHIAILPLPFVGGEHADGRIMGVALALPRALQEEEAKRVLEAWLYADDRLPRSIRLFDGHWLECLAELETRDYPPYSLRVETWVEPARAWASVTPVVLDRHFDGPEKWDLAAESIKTACERAGLPRPSEVLLHPVSQVLGVPRSNEFPCLIRKRSGERKRHIHAVIHFDVDVEGPVLIGAGRYRGYGLFRPMDQQGAHRG